MFRTTKAAAPETTNTIKKRKKSIHFCVPDVDSKTTKKTNKNKYFVETGNWVKEKKILFKRRERIVCSYFGNCRKILAD